MHNNGYIKHFKAYTDFEYLIILQVLHNPRCEEGSRILSLSQTDIMKTPQCSGDGVRPRTLLPRHGTPIIMIGVDFTSAYKVFPHLNVLNETQNKQAHLRLFLFQHFLVACV